MAGPQASKGRNLPSKRVRSESVLFGAWNSIRRNAETSQVKSTKEEAKVFGQDLLKNIHKLQRRLREGYIFEKPYGATPKKGPGKVGNRPIVVAPLHNRIVQRAILDVLQNANDMPRIKAVLATPTSIGGIPGRGVENALKIFDQCAADGYSHVAGSDIAGFFTKIPKAEVFEFLEQEVADPAFMELTRAALTVELSNADRLSPDDLRLFPTDEEGVAQGCPLSALAGNIVLREFDCEMNAPGKGLRCIRYIDDFIVIGRSRTSVMKGMDAARSMLSGLGMNIYDAEEAPTKAFVGRVGEPFEFLGRKLIPGQYPPGEAAKKKLCQSIDQLINDGQTAVHKAVNGRRLGSTDKPFGPTVVAISNAIRGWRGCYRYSNCPEVFAALDHHICRRLIDFEAYLNTHAPKKDRSKRVAALGLRQLGDGI
jgi:retron-type reverse transcriptase